MADATADHGLIGDRRARSLAGARRRSARVRGLRIALVAAMGLLGLNAGVQLLLNSAPAPTSAPFTPAGSNERIVNPRFTGRDQGGAPFTLTADAATRRSGGIAGLAELENPALDYAFIQADDSSRILSRAGVFDEGEQTLQLRENVRLATRSGYTFTTEAALLRLREGRIEGDVPVSGAAPWGAVRAQSFQVREEGRRIILSGDVRTRIYLDQTQEPLP
jgi:lipopolysaccharide export system protein LptC